MADGENYHSFYFASLFQLLNEGHMSPTPESRVTPLPNSTKLNGKVCSYFSYILGYVWAMRSLAVSSTCFILCLGITRIICDRCLVIDS